MRQKKHQSSSWLGVVALTTFYVDIEEGALGYLSPHFGSFNNKLNIQTVSGIDFLRHIGLVVTEDDIKEVYLTYKSILSWENNSLRVEYQDHIVFINKNISLKQIMDTFISKEVKSCNLMHYDLNNLNLFNGNMLNSTNNISFLQKSMVQKNIYLCSLYYKSLSFKKLEYLIKVNLNIFENEIQELIKSNRIIAKIDRSLFVINFNNNRNRNNVIGDLFSNINTLVDLVDTVSDKIDREIN